MAGPKFYAVRSGRGGPNIYTTWKETEEQVRGFKNARHKSFPTERQAREWLKAGDDQEDKEKANHHQTLRSAWFQNRVKKEIEHDSTQFHSQSGHLGIKQEIGTPYQSLNRRKRYFDAEEDDGEVEDEQEDKKLKIIDDPFYEDLIGSVCERDPTYVLRDTEHSYRKLSDDQKRVFDAVREGRSLFFTGSAGTGKSFLLKTIIKYLKDYKINLAVTASTGIAASHLSGTTLHSFAGIGLGKEKPSDLVWKIRKSKHSRERWKMVEVLIIDEISMVDGILLDKLEYIARSVRENEEPFGGIQLILAGDFFQLPPVSIGEVLPYAFQANCWRRCVPQVITLQLVFRQTNQEFVELLNDMRIGQVSEKNRKLLQSLSREVKYNDEILPTELYPRKDDVARANSNHLRKINQPELIFEASDRPGEPLQNVSSMELRSKLDKNLLVPFRLSLKIGAQVMLVKNMPEEELVNGSVGVIVGFAELPDDPNHPNVGKRSTPLPIVKFTNGHQITVSSISFEIEAADGTVLASRSQIPLILAWALSIHKSQGQTLERVIVNLKQSFEKGQVYVALSRATSLDSLQVIGFEPRTVEAHPVVLQWAGLM